MHHNSMHIRNWVDRTLACGTSILLVSAFLFGGTAAAADDRFESGFDDRFYITPSATLGFFGRVARENCLEVSQETGNCLAEPASQTVHPDADIGARLAFGKRLFEYLGLEAQANYFDGDVQDRGEFDRWGVGANALVYPFGASLPVYALVGYGIGEHDYDNVPGNVAGFRQPPITNGDSEDSEYLDLGVGFNIRIPDHDAYIRTEYRHRASDVDTPGGGDVTFRDNIFSVGLQIPLGAAPPEPAPEPRPCDCPEPKPRPEPEPEPEPEPIVLQGTNFEYDEATLRSQAASRLGEVVDELEAHPEVDVRIEGHTDHNGSKSYNQRLSQARAESVSSYLVEHGIDASRIVEVKGYGESQPVAPNTKPDGSDNPEGRAKNRRVEIHKVQ